MENFKWLTLSTMIVQIPFFFYYTKQNTAKRRQTNRKRSKHGHNRARAPGVPPADPPRDLAREPSSPSGSSSTKTPSWFAAVGGGVRGAGDDGEYDDATRVDDDDDDGLGEAGPRSCIIDRRVPDPPPRPPPRPPRCACPPRPEPRPFLPPLSLFLRWRDPCSLRLRVLLRVCARERTAMDGEFGAEAACVFPVFFFFFFPRVTISHFPPSSPPAATLVPLPLLPLLGGVVVASLGSFSSNSLLSLTLLPLSFCSLLPLPSLLGEN